jgi:glycosyltransferase involved in cell wall biosynthesis
MNVLMLVMSDVMHDSRVLREAVALADQGHAIHIVGKDVPAGWAPPRGVTVESVSGGSGLKPGGSGAGASRGPVASATRVRRTARWLLLPRHRQRVWGTWCARAEAAVRGREFEVVHAHDFNVLRLAADLADRAGARLVYDSHEWWSGRERHGRPTPLERARERRTERRLVRRADAVLTVSAGIAERLGKWRGGKVLVVRNTFPAVGAGAVPVPDRPSGVVYAGRIGAARDLETLLPAAAAARLETCLMGQVDREYLHRIHVAGGTVRIEPARPVDEVDDVLRRGGISVVTLTDSCENHRLALPNKLFHAVRAGVPVVAADLPELRRVVTEYGLGQLYRSGDVESMRAALDLVVADYPRWCKQVAQAKDELSWERDAAVLVGVYATLAGRDVQPVSAR